MPAHIHPTIVQFASNLVLRVHGSLSSSVSGCTWLIQNHRVPRVPLLGVGVTHYQDDFQSHLRRHYSSFTAHTDSCARPYPSQRLGFSLVRWVFAGCRQSLLGNGPSQHYLCNPCIGARTLTPQHPFGAFTHFFPKDFGLTSRFTGSTRQISVAMQLQRRGKFRGCSHSITFKLPYLLDPLVALTTEHI